MQQFTTHAVLPACNHGRYELELSPDGTRARVRLSSGAVNIQSASRWQDIKEDRHGRPFVTFWHKKILLEQCKKI